MEIMFSRHSKRRIRLYGIPEQMVKDIFKDIVLPLGKHEIIKNIPALNFPLKVVFLVEDGIITIITAYPLKKVR